MGIGGVSQINMKLLYTSKPENKGGWTLSVFSIFIFIIIGTLLYEERLFMEGFGNYFDYAVFFVLCIIVISLLVYLIREAFWQMFGLEICEYDDNGVKITKKIIFKKRFSVHEHSLNKYNQVSKTKFIKWDEISNVTEMETPPIWNIITHFTLAGVSQNKITIHYRRRMVFRCGTNLSKAQIRDILDVTHKMIEKQRMKQ